MEIQSCRVILPTSSAVQCFFILPEPCFQPLTARRDLCNGRGPVSDIVRSPDFIMARPTLPRSKPELSVPPRKCVRGFGFVASATLHRNDLTAFQTPKSMEGYAGLTQWLESQPSKLSVGGSSPPLRSNHATIV